MFPVFFCSKLCDVVDFARIEPECPPLLSKGEMKSWDVNMDFGREVIHIRKHSHSVPFTKHSPCIDLFDLGDPATFDRNQVPKCFWITS